jgi:hypothetical protein
MGSLNARRQVIEEMLLPEVGIFPHACSTRARRPDTHRMEPPDGPGDLQLMYSP